MVTLKPGEADRILAGHPWVYQNEVLRATDNVKDGEFVQVRDHHTRLLGAGFYNSKSKISVRILAPDRIRPNEAFFEERILAALAVRQRHLPGATSFRVVNAESDFLSGLIVDKYEDVLVVQISSLGMDQRKEHIVAALQKIFSPRAIMERSDVASRKFEGLEAANGVLTGECDGKISVNLNGLKFETDLIGGHKTGMYLDQQANYQAVSQFGKGGQVLDCFSFLGGFGLHAARAGAAHVHLLDQSEDAIEASKRNAAANGLAEQCSYDTINVFDWLKNNTAVKPHERRIEDVAAIDDRLALHGLADLVQIEQKEVIPRFDLIILDPPSFTRNRASVPDALRGYKEIHLRALKLLKPGGTLATFCCSHHVSPELFQDTLLSAAFDTRHVLRRVATYAQSPDHPVIPMIPETEYLKGFAFEKVR